MAISRRDQRELAQLYSDLSDKYGGNKEDYFALLFLQKKLKCQAEDVIHQIAFGGNDYGIDAYYFDREAKNLYLYQFKWSENHNLFKESLDRLTSNGMAFIFGHGLPDPSLNEVIKRLKADLYEYQSVVHRVFVHFVFKGDIETAENSSGLNARKEDLEDKQYLLEQFFGNQNVKLIVEFISDVRSPSPPPLQDTFEIAFQKNISTQTNDGNKFMHIGLMSLIDLHRIYETLGQKFFSRNIRAGLSPDNPPNRKIRTALASIVIKKQMTPDVFVFNHNGITLAAEDLNFSNGKATLSAPRLLNGAQTVTSLIKFLEDNADNQNLLKNENILNQIQIIGKIVVCRNCDDFITNVTMCNNQQNPVDPWNLRANDLIQCDLQDKFLEDLSIYYSRQENAFQSLSEEELLDLGIEDRRDIRIKLMAQTLLSFQGEIDKMSRLREVFESDKVYRDTFKQNYLNSDTRKIVLAYKTLLMINSPMKILKERSADWMYYAVSGARNLVHALLVQGLLNDDHLGMFLEDYGTTLTKEVDFREHLKNLATKRVLPILRDVFKEDHYKTRINKEKHSFLRTKELYKKCMEVAFEKHEWTKKHL